MLFGYFEILVLTLLIGSNLYIQRIPFNINIYYLVIILLFGFILPLIAMKIEIEIAILKGMERDGMYFLWTTFKFPIYWIIGIFQILFLTIKKSN